MKPSFKYIYEKYFKPLCFTANRYVIDEGDGEDIVCKLMLRLWERWDNFGEDEEKIKAWLYIGLRNACLNFISIQKTRNKIRLPLLEDSVQSIEATIIHAEVLISLTNCLDKLPPKCQKICRAWMNADRGSHNKLANELGISIYTYWNHVQKATNLIKMQMGLSYNMHFADHNFYRKKKAK